MIIFFPDFTYISKLFHVIYWDKFSWIELLSYCRLVCVLDIINSVYFI